MPEEKYEVEKCQLKRTEPTFSLTDGPFHQNDILAQLLWLSERYTALLC